jgi:hypothetical protein
MPDINLSATSYFEINPFLNICKNATGFVPNEATTTITLDNNGYVSSVTPVTGKYKCFFQNIGNLYKADSKFIVAYQGLGTIQYLGGVLNSRIVQNGWTIDNFSLNPNNPSALTQLSLLISNADPTNYVRNLQIWEEDSLISSSVGHVLGTSSLDSIFNPSYISKLQPFSTIRVMDLQKTNGSSIQNFTDFTPFDFQNWQGPNGVPLQVIADLANETGKNIWINIPHAATNDCVDKMGQFFVQALKSNIKVFVEYTNEAWNKTMAQYAWLTLQVPASSIPAVQFQNLMAFYAKRTNEVIGIFEQYFSSDRLNGVLSWWAADSDGVADILIPNCPKAKILAIAPYFGYYLGSPIYQPIVEKWFNDADGGLTKLFQELISGGLLTAAGSGGLVLAEQWCKNYKAIVDTYNTNKLPNQNTLQLACYESGQSLLVDTSIQNTPYGQKLNNLFVAAQMDSRMGDLYFQFGKDWHDLFGDGPNCSFSYINKYGKWGYWGVLQSLQNTPSPKYDAMQKLGVLYNTLPRVALTDRKF